MKNRLKIKQDNTYRHTLVVSVLCVTPRLQVNRPHPYQEHLRLPSQARLHLQLRLTSQARLHLQLRQLQLRPHLPPMKQVHLHLHRPQMTYKELVV